MPGITPSRYVRGISNPHSAYASAEIPENVTIFKNLSRWQTTAPTISVSQFCHCHDLRANDTQMQFARTTPPDKGFNVSRSIARVYADAILARANPRRSIYSRVLRMCGHLIYYPSRLSLPSWSRNPPLLWPLSLSSWNHRYSSEWFVTSCYGLRSEFTVWNSMRRLENEHID